MINCQVPELDIKEWDKLKLAEVVHEKSIANAKSLFLDLKINDKIMETARVDDGLRQEIKQVEADMKAISKERDELLTINQGLKVAEAKLLDEKRKITSARKALKEEKSNLTKQIKQLEL